MKNFTLSAADGGANLKNRPIFCISQYLVDLFAKSNGKRQIIVVLYRKTKIYIANKEERYENYDRLRKK